MQDERHTLRINQSSLLTPPIGIKLQAEQIANARRRAAEGSLTPSPSLQIHRHGPVTIVSLRLSNSRYQRPKVFNPILSPIPKASWCTLSSHTPSSALQTGISIGMNSAMGNPLSSCSWFLAIAAFISLLATIIWLLLSSSLNDTVLPSP